MRSTPRQLIRTDVPAALHNKLQQYAAKKGVSKSSVNHAALARYLDDTNHDQAILRKLDRIERNQERGQRDSEFFVEAFAVFVQIWMAHTPRLADADKPSAEQSVLQRFREYASTSWRRWPRAGLSSQIRLANTSSTTTAALLNRRPNHVAARDEERVSVLLRPPPPRPTTPPSHRMPRRAPPPTRLPIADRAALGHAFKCAHDLLDGAPSRPRRGHLRGIARRSRVQIGGPLRALSHTFWVPFRLAPGGSAAALPTLTVDLPAR